MASYFLDTNTIWWYFVENSKHHQKVAELMNPLLLNPENSFLVNEIVIIELMHLLIKKKGRKGYQIALELLQNRYTFFEIRFDIRYVKDLTEILEILDKFGNKTSIGGRDASILYSMQMHQVKNIITNDQAFNENDEINVVDPLK